MFWLILPVRFYLVPHASGRHLLFYCAQIIVTDLWTAREPLSLHYNLLLIDACRLT